MKLELRHALPVLIAALALAGCSDSENGNGNGNENDVQEQAEETMAEAKETVEAAGEKAEKTVEAAEEKAKETVSKAEKKVERAAAEQMRLDEDVPERAVAILHPTKGNDVRGSVVFDPAQNGLEVTTRARGLSKGEHGYHIHLYGDCTAADGTSAGTHFNLEGSSLDPPEDIDRITGNLGNLSAGKDGNATHQTVLEGASLTGPKSIIGRSVIVHAKANNPDEPPIGAAGPRQACGVIGIRNPE